jgi:hypothetical protein
MSNGHIIKGKSILNEEFHTVRFFGGIKVEMISKAEINKLFDEVLNSSAEDEEINLEYSDNEET